MRVGSNPVKSVSNEPVQQKKIIIAVLCYIPILEGYHSESLEVLKLCIGSILQNTDLPYDLYIFDNGSCDSVIKYLLELKENKKIQHLHLSIENLGKAGAWNWIFGITNSEYVVYTDSDVFFYPGWLSAALHIYEAFPNVGMVTSCPIQSPDVSFNSKMMQLLESDSTIEIKKGKYISKEFQNEYAEGLGLSLKEYQATFPMDYTDVLLKCNGVEAYLHASHFQFLIKPSLIRNFLPLSCFSYLGKATAQFDKKIIENNLLRLSCTERYILHIGNTLTERLREEAIKYNIDIELKIKKNRAIKNGIVLQKFFHLKLVKMIFLKIYNIIFSIYFETKKYS
ncbi:MAG: glycosyltransferase family 2 protein [Candidatus Firestonebacteria bacterium]|nr:glycosyltransferase family 2 protein [Candidatus Firestonebacteria bacterium]